MARSQADKEEAAAMLAEAEANTEGPVLSADHALILFALVARQGFCAQSDLGVACEADDRVALEKQGFVSEVKREQNELWLKLSDSGWDWASTSLNKALPPSQHVLHYFLVRLAAHLEAEGESLRDFIGTREIGAMDPGLTTV